MRELSMHILDLAQNSIAAGASLIEIDVIADKKSDSLKISIRDNGAGMSAEYVAQVRYPFTTSRTTRRVGLGIPMFAEAARECDGDLTLDSSPGEGTCLEAVFKLSHIDRAPMGDISSTLIALIAANPDIDIVYRHQSNSSEFMLDTRELRVQLDGVALNENAVLKWIAEYVADGLSDKSLAIDN
ncbi:MAG: ATP-binding protein [Armatimonadetes bacterium]|nr:ATP-binding protein [Armatimonadota bacterium]